MKFSQILELIPSFQTSKDFKKLPEIFCYKYGPTIPDNVSIKDPVGNFFYIKLKRWGDEWYVSHGWKMLVDFYSMAGGVFIRLSYAGLGIFHSQVFDNKEQQIRIHVDHSSSPTNIMRAHPLVKPINPSNFIFTMEKTLDFEEAIGVKLKLEKSFCACALIRRGGDVTIIDEEYKPWHCHITHQVSDPFYSWLTAGWAPFCSAKRLHHGKSIKLGVPNSSVLYYIPC